VIVHGRIRRLTGPLVAGALGAIALAGCLPESKRHLDRGRILFERRDLKAARAELKQALKADPDLLEAHKLLARVDEYLGDQQDAALEYQAAARLDPADPRLRNKARFYRRQLDRSVEPSGRPGPTPAPAHG
jgi:tetratricopeptide (TPR) repeat protein